jgi:hypothetical protein
MNRLLFFTLSKPTFVAVLTLRDCGQKVVETLLAQSWKRLGKVKN